MKISELKVGNTVKYKIEHGICGTNHHRDEITSGKILEVFKDFVQIENNKYYNNQISVLKTNIIFAKKR